MLPENSAGPSIETFMIGSRIFGFARGKKSRNAPRAASWNAMSLESTACACTVVDRDAEADDRHAEARRLRDHRLEALLARRDELARDRAALDLVDELEVALERLGVAGDAAVLARATGLLLVGVVELDLLALIVSRYATCGGEVTTSALYSRFMRSM